MKVLCPFIKETSNFCFAKVLELKSAEAPKRKTEYYLDQKDWNMFKLKKVQCKIALFSFWFWQ